MLIQKSLTQTMNLGVPPEKAREESVLKKYLLDSEMEILVDDSFIRNIVSISQKSKF